MKCFPIVSICVVVVAFFSRYVSLSASLKAPEGNIRPETAQADNMMDIGTRTIFTEDHDMFRQSVRKFFQEEVAPHQAE